MRVLFLIIFFISTLYASDQSLATQIYLSLGIDISEKKDPKFYLHGDIKYLKNSKKIHTVKSCQEADIIIINTLKDLPKACLVKPIFTTKYRTYLNYPDIIGAFFWQKGRPNIIFRKSALKKSNIHLEPSLSKYIR